MQPRGNGQHVDWDSFLTSATGKREPTIYDGVGPRTSATGKKLPNATTVQGDTSGCDKPPVDFKMKVLFWPVLALPVKIGTFVLKSTGGSAQPDVSLSPCTLISNFTLKRMFDLSILCRKKDAFATFQARVCVINLDTKKRKVQCAD